MSWYLQAKLFFKAVGETRAREESQEEDKQKMNEDDLEFITSVSEARLLSAPKGASFLIFLLFVFLVSLVSWSMIMEVDEVVKANGKVIPSKQVQVIQNLEGGIINSIKVVEGQIVKKGEELIVINNVSAVSDLNDNAHQYNILLARLVALNTLIEGKRLLNFPKELQLHIDIISHERERFNSEWREGMTKIKEIEFAIDQRKKEYDLAKGNLVTAKDDYTLAKEELAINKVAFNKQVIPKVAYIKSKKATNNSKANYIKAKHEVPKAKASLNEVMQKRESFIQERVVNFKQERAEIESKLNTMQSKGVSLQAQVDHSVVVSPVFGTIKKINFNTVGGVIRPGMDIMEIIPSDDKLLIEAKLMPKDIGFVHNGLATKVKLTAYDFSTYGGLNGVIKFVSADTITDEKGKSYFLIRILTQKNYILDKQGKKHMIIPGMQTDIDIVVDKKSIFSYILKPMLK